jgi:DNA/RNA non-specific endonuclease
VTCQNGHFYRDNHHIDLQKFKCKRKNFPTLQGVTGTSKLCPSLSHYQIGFQFPNSIRPPAELVFVKFVDLCYNLQSGSTVFTKHTIYGQSINNKMKPPKSFSWTNTGLKPTVMNIIADNYIINFQKKRFNTQKKEIIGDQPSQRYYAKGHLTPDADGIYTSCRDATYFYMNTVPQWQKINNGNWKSIEYMARSVAGRIRNEVEVYTGGYQSHGSFTTGGVDIPKWIFKAVITNDAGIVFLTLNDIYAKEKPSEPCKDICGDYGVETSLLCNSEWSKIYSIREMRSV